MRLLSAFSLDVFWEIQLLSDMYQEHANDVRIVLRLKGWCQERVGSTSVIQFQRANDGKVLSTMQFLRGYGVRGLE